MPKSKNLEIPCPDGVTPQVWTDWLAHRKAKRAPVTPTVVRCAIAEAAKARMTLEDFLIEWLLRGSQGLKASWLDKRQPGPAEPAWRVEQRERAEAFAGPAAARRRADVVTVEVVSAAPRRLG